MDVRLQFLQPLLVLDAEMLLLVDDQQAEIAELDGFAQQRMGADDDVDGTVGNALLGLGQLAVGTSREAWATLIGSP
jgi:hypothetical protein